MNATTSNIEIVNTRPMNAVSTAQTYVWLVKRELWEHRAIFITPLIFAALVIFGMTIAAFQIAHQIGLNPADVAEKIPIDKIPFAKVRVVAMTALAAMFSVIMLFVVGYYALDALFAERRDRSVLFWKSLPISDFESVMSKLLVAVVVAPLIALATAIVTQFIIALILTAVFVANGHSEVFQLWNINAFAEIAVVLIYGVIVQALWYLPLWSWCLLASAWARRTPFLVAIIPPVALVVLEAIIFRTRYISTLIGQRLNGVFPVKYSLIDMHAQAGPQAGDDFQLPEHVTQLIDPSRFLAMPDLWIGLLIAGALIAATIWMRRYRETN